MKRPNELAEIAKNLPTCPFCGWEPVVEISRFLAIPNKEEGKVPLYQIRCENERGCFVRPKTFAHYNIDVAILAWSKRPNEAIPRGDWTADEGIFIDNQYVELVYKFREICATETIELLRENLKQNSQHKQGELFE